MLRTDGKMRRYTIFLVVFIAASMGARQTYAQRQVIGDCPVVSVSCPDSDLGPTLTVNASVPGGDPKLTFKWTVSAGKITSGQGTPSISVDTSGLGGQSFTASVEVGGFDKACPNAASCSIIFCRMVKARKFDEYGASVAPLPVTHKKFHRRHQHRRQSTNQIVGRSFLPFACSIAVWQTAS